MEKYNVDVDYLKIGHHGSITSSTEKFIDAVNPEEVFIMAKRNNFMNHPNDIVIERLSLRSIIINRTDLHGSIEIVYYSNKEIKKYYSP